MVCRHFRYLSIVRSVNKIKVRKNEIRMHHRKEKKKRREIKRVIEISENKIIDKNEKSAKGTVKR